MRSFTVAAAFAALAVANPLPQEIDWAAVDALAPIPTVTIPVVDVSAQASTVSYEPSAAATSVEAEVKASGFSSASAGLKARAAVTCKPQLTGAGPVPTPDTPEAFLAYNDFSTTAKDAQTPSGYYNTFTDLQASNNAYGYVLAFPIDNVILVDQRADTWDTLSSASTRLKPVLISAMPSRVVLPSTSTSSATQLSTVRYLEPYDNTLC